MSTELIVPTSTGVDVYRDDELVERRTIRGDGGIGIEYFGDGEISRGGGFLKKATKILNNDQIKALPTTPVAIVLATQTDPFTQLFVPVAAVALLDNTAGAYGNVGSDPDPDPQLYLAYGSDVSSEAGLRCTHVHFDQQGRHLAIFSFPQLRTGSDPLPSLYTRATSPLAGAILDNALVLAGFNAGTGDNHFTGGHADNTLKVTVYYVVEDL
jgi:hypothetical protein